MPNWNEILDDLNTRGSTHDIIRREYIRKLSEKTGRNVIVYYSGFLQPKPGDDRAVYAIGDADKTGFMTCINKLDTHRGLDLLLHTPGGDAFATESLVDYLRSKFGTNIRAIVPQIAMSAGTMIACACKEIVMGKQSSIGPIDPQIGGMAAHAIVEEFEDALKNITATPQLTPAYQIILSKYPPTLVQECRRAIKWSEQAAGEWLRSGMFEGDPEANPKAKKVLDELASHENTKSHARHIPAKRAREIGLKVIDLESDNELQDLVLSVHHCCIHTLTSTSAFKIIENHLGKAFISMQQLQVFQTR